MANVMLEILDGFSLVWVLIHSPGFNKINDFKFRIGVNEY